MTQPSEIPQSAQTTSVVCVDFGNAIDFHSQSFQAGLFIPIFFFCVGLGISAIMKVIRSI
ncbi:hypothetical protein EIL26_00580 [Salmonella enterica subsp. enterica serovar Newport]|nr:hypothetical protein [Salmonella enterica]ECA0400400.1 hypothetical protein [Salmonella enterica subsp. enterica serovar Newport]